MKTLLFLRTGRLIKSLLVVVFVSTILTAFKSPIPALLSVFAIYFLAASMFRSGWFLNLPGSRKKLGLYFLLETALFWLICTAAVGFLFIVYGGKSAPKEIQQTLYGAGLFSVFAFLLFVVVPVMKFHQRQMTDLARLTDLAKFSLKGAKPFWILIAIVLGLRFSDKEIWFLLAVAIAMVACLPLAWAQSVTAPENLYNRIKSNCTLAASGLVIFMICGAYYYVHKGDPGDNNTQASVRFLGSLPLFISENRLVELARSPKATASLADGRLDRIAKNIAWPELLELTKKCETESCLEFRDELARATAYKSQDSIEFFTATLTVCSPGLFASGWIGCQGPRLGSKKIEAWLVLLRERGKVDEWLKSEKPEQQFAAMRSVWYFNYSAEQLTAIEKLRESKNSLIAATAIHFVNYHMRNAALKGTCGKETKENKEYCAEEKVGIGELL